MEAESELQQEHCNNDVCEERTWTQPAWKAADHDPTFVLPSQNKTPAEYPDIE